MSLFAYLNGSDTAHSVRLGQLGLTTKADGSSGFGNIVFDDPDCSLDIRPWMRVIVKETACSDPLIFAGFVADRTYSRSNGEVTYKDGAARFIDTTITDLNTLLQFQAMFAAEANRPAESEEDRIDWLLGSQYVQGVTAGLVNSSAGRQLEANDYRQQYPNDVLSSLVNTWIFFVYPDQPDGDPLLFYDTPTASTGTSDLSISNDLADITLDANGEITGDCYPASIGAQMVRDPSELYARIGLYWVGGREIQSNPTTLATYFTPSGLGYRSLAYTSDRVKSGATATQYAARMLARDATENETITDTIIVPKEKVGLVQAGYMISTKYLHFGDDDFVDRRISAVEVHQADGTNERYAITIEMNAKGSDAIGGGGGSPGDFPHPPPATASIVQQASGAGSITMPSGNVAAGDTLVVVVNSRGSLGSSWSTYAALGYSIVVQETVPGGGNQSTILYKLADGSEGDSLNLVSGHASGTWYELPGEWTPADSTTATGAGSPVTVGPVDSPTSGIVFTANAYAQGGALDTYVGTGNDMSTSPGSGWTEDYDASTPAGGTPISYTAHEIASGSITGTSANAVGAADAAGVGTTNWCAVIAAFSNADLAAGDPPTPGQEVPWTVVTVTPGSTTSTGTTAFPYAAGSLKVKVDGVLISPASYVETDPTTGDFTLSWVIDSDEVVTVSYQGL